MAIKMKEIYPLSEKKVQLKDGYDLSVQRLLSKFKALEEIL